MAMQLRAVRLWFSRTRVSLGLEVGSAQIKGVYLLRQAGKWTVQEEWKVAIPSAVQEQPEQRGRFLYQTLNDYLTRAAVPFFAEIHLAISEPEAFSTTLLIPRAKPAEIAGAVAAELSQRLPYPIKEAAWRFSAGPETIELEGEKIPLFVSATSHSWIQQLAAICRSLHLVPASIAVSSEAMLRFLHQTELMSDAQILALLEIGVSSSTLLCLNKGWVEYLRAIPVGADQFLKGLIRTVSTPRGDRAITAQEAERILRSCGIEILGETAVQIPGVEGLGTAQVYAILRPIMEAFFLEIQRTLYYYSQTYKRPRPERMLVSGVGACIPSLVEFLNANADDTAVEALHPLALLKSWGEPPASVQEEMGPVDSQFVVSIGAASPPAPKMPAAVPFFYRSNARIAWTYLLAQLAAILALVTTLALTGYVQMERVSYERFQQEKRSQLSRLLPKVEKIEEYGRLKLILLEKEALVGKVVPRQPLWVGVMKELSRITPEGIRLNLVETEGDLSSPLNLRIEGEIVPTYTSVEVVYAQYQLALEQSPFFSEIQLVTMKKDMYSPTPRATFQLRCRVVY